MTSLPPNETITIRAMQAEDLEQVQAIDQLSFTVPWPASAFRYELNENPASLLWVAETGPNGGPRKVVGMVVVWLILDEAHIATIAVHPDYRDLGIGRRLLASALRGAILNGMTLATLEVREHNLSAQTIYRRFGFEVAGRRPRYYRDNNEDALIMTIEKLDEAYLQWLETGVWLERRNGGAPSAG